MEDYYLYGDPHYDVENHVLKAKEINKKYEDLDSDPDIFALNPNCKIETIQIGAHPDETVTIIDDFYLYPEKVRRNMVKNDELQLYTRSDESLHAGSRLCVDFNCEFLRSRNDQVDIDINVEIPCPDTSRVITLENMKSYCSLLITELNPLIGPDNEIIKEIQSIIHSRGEVLFKNLENLYETNKGTKNETARILIDVFVERIVNGLKMEIGKNRNKFAKKQMSDKMFGILWKHMTNIDKKYKYIIIPKEKNKRLQKYFLSRLVANYQYINQHSSKIQRYPHIDSNKVNEKSYIVLVYLCKNLDGQSEENGTEFYKSNILNKSLIAEGAHEALFKIDQKENDKNSNLECVKKIGLKFNRAIIYSHNVIHSSSNTKELPLRFCKNKRYVMMYSFFYKCDFKDVYLKSVWEQYLVKIKSNSNDVKKVRELVRDESIYTITRKDNLYTEMMKIFNSIKKILFAELSNIFTKTLEDNKDNETSTKYLTKILSEMTHQDDIRTILEKNDFNKTMGQIKNQESKYRQNLINELAAVSSGIIPYFKVVRITKNTNIEQLNSIQYDIEQKTTSEDKELLIKTHTFMFITQNKYDDQPLLSVNFITGDEFFSYDTTMIIPEIPLLYNYTLEINKNSEKEGFLIIGGIYNKA